MAELLFVGGSGGSGTRAVVQFLQQLGCYAGHELNESLDSMPVARLLDQWVDRWLGRDTADAKATRQLTQTFAAEFAQALQRHLQGCEASICVVKNPRSMLLLELLFKIRPDLRYLHLVRHGGAMVYSSNQRQFDLHSHHWSIARAGDTDSDLVQARLAFWAASNLQASHIGERHPGQYAWLQYEAFCEEPLEQMQQAFKKLGLEADWHKADQSLLQPSGRERQQAGAIAGLDLTVVRPALKKYGYSC